MKEVLCRAFCDGIQVRPIGGTLAVSTTFVGPDGDRIGFYIRKSGDGGSFKIEDNGAVLPMLEASGLSFKSGTRAEMMRSLLRDYGVSIDEGARGFVVGDLAEADVPAAAMRFVAFSLRVRDFLLLTEARVAHTFREDVERLLREKIGDRAVIEERTAIAASLADFAPDFLVRAQTRPPVAIYLGTSDAAVLQAVVVQMRSLHEVRVPCSVVALLEKDKSISAKVRQQALNRLDLVVEFRGDEDAAIERVAREALGPSVAVH